MNTLKKKASTQSQKSVSLTFFEGLTRFHHLYSKLIHLSRTPWYFYKVFINQPDNFKYFLIINLNCATSNKKSLRIRWNDKKKQHSKVTLPFVTYLYTHPIHRACNCVWDLSTACVVCVFRWRRTIHTYMYVSHMFDHDFCIIKHKKKIWLIKIRSFTYLLGALSWPSVSSLDFVVFWFVILCCSIYSNLY